jgi:hypothetical protein
MTADRHVDEATRDTYQPAPTDSMSASVVQAIADHSDRAVDRGENALPPLYETIDPDALDALFAVRHDPPLVQFTYSGYTVTIDETRQITVADT